MIGTRVEIIGENSTFLQHVCPRWIGEKGVVVAITQDRIGSLYQVQLDSGRKFESINGPIDPYFRDYELKTAGEVEGGDHHIGNFRAAPPATAGDAGGGGSAPNNVGPGVPDPNSRTGDLQGVTMSSSAVQAKKSDRVKFGVTGKPVVAKQVFMKAMEHDSQKSTKSWILVTPDNRVLRVNTYDGNAGKNFDPNGEGVSHEMPDQKTWNKKLKGYTEVAISECPIATAAETTPPTETSPSTNS